MAECLSRNSALPRTLGERASCATPWASTSPIDEHHMRLGFFTMPIHPLDKDWRQSLREDREAFILADQLGFAEGYVGEHATDKAENITSCAVFIASLIDATKKIK